MDPNNKRIFEEEKERLKKATKKSLHNLIRAETQEKHNSDHVDMIGMRNMYNKIIRFLEKDSYLLSWDLLFSNVGGFHSQNLIDSLIKEYKLSKKCVVHLYFFGANKTMKEAEFLTW